MSSSLGVVTEGLPSAGADGSWLLSSGRVNEMKSVSLTGGAGAEGEGMGEEGGERGEGGDVAAAPAD